MTKRKGPTPKKFHIKLKMIPEPEPDTRAVMIMIDPDQTVVMRGDAAPNVVMDCGQCGTRLTEGIGSMQVQNMVFKYNGCGAFNETVEG